VVVTERRGSTFLVGLDRPEASNVLGKIASPVPKVIVSGTDIRELLDADVADAGRVRDVRHLDVARSCGNQRAGLPAAELLGKP
jgi:hypothetical protein